MSAFLDQETQPLPRNSRSAFLDQETQPLSRIPRSPARLARHARYEKWFTLLFWIVVVALFTGAVTMRLYHLDVPFDRDGYDEGVYWQSLRAMLAGQSLYHPIFYSQPPAFLLSVFPNFALFGGSLWSARFGIVLVSLLGFLGAYLLGKSLAGRLGVLAALLLLLVSSLYIVESQTLQAEAPFTAFTLLAIGFAFLWWQQPDGWRGICWAALTGITLVLSILSKLLPSILVPITLLLFARIWQIWRKQPGTSSRSWLPILAGIGCALLTTLILMLPFLGSFQDLWSSVVTFHEVAAKLLAGTMSGNYQKISPQLFSLLGLTALYGVLTALLRRDWRVLPLLAWVLVTLVLLLRQYPLFPHHLVALEPPLLALAVLGVAEPASSKWLLSRLKLEKLAPGMTVVAVLLILITSVFSFQQDLSYYQSNVTQSTNAATQLNLRVAADLSQAITPDQWVITDGQFIAGLADRNVPPFLVDTSSVRSNTQFFTVAQLEQTASDPRVHAVLFYNSRFRKAFHVWVTRHFHRLHAYGGNKELWVL